MGNATTPGTTTSALNVNELTGVDVHVMTVDGRELVRSRVMRAFVFQLAADRIVYRGALAFDRPVELASAR